MQQFFLVDISQKPATENTMYLGNDILEPCLLAAFPRDLYKLPSASPESL